MHEKTSRTLGLALGIPLGCLVVFCVCKTVILCHLWVRRVRKLRAARAEWQAAGAGDWEIDLSDIKVATDAEGQDVVLGAGTFGTVVQGIKGDVQPVAIKTMARTGDMRTEEAFVREIAMLKYLSRDRNIVQFYGACVQSSTMLLVAELMEGGDLRTALDQDTTGRFHWWQQGKSIAVDVARGLAFLHSSGVIHRDLKSANVLLTEAGSAKIADVGLAKMAGGEWRPGRDQVFGTLSFAAPEVLLGERTTEKVDIYSLGVVLWEIATGVFPQRGGIRELTADEAPPEVAALITACMQQPLCRPSAREVCRVLYKAAPAWHEPPDVRALLDVSSPDISEDMDLLPGPASQEAAAASEPAADADRLRTDRLASERPQLQGIIHSIRARLDATRGNGVGGKDSSAATGSTRSVSVAVTASAADNAVASATPQPARRRWWDLAWRNLLPMRGLGGHAAHGDIIGGGGGGGDGSSNSGSSGWEVVPTVRRGNVVQHLAAMHTASAAAEAATGADSQLPVSYGTATDGSDAEAAAETTECAQ